MPDAGENRGGRWTMPENKGLQALESLVIRRDLCTLCGACASLCPYLRSWQGKVIKLHECDLSEGRCYAYCPRTEVDLEAIHRALFGQDSLPMEMGPFRRVFVARAREPELRDGVQAGGVVSALMDLAISDGLIHAAVLTHRNEDHLPEGCVATTRAEVLACAGSSYVAGPTIEALNRRPWKEGERIGVVGVPCQVLALAKMRASALDRRMPIDQVGIVIGLFCTWALAYGPFLEFLGNRFPGISIGKLDITPPPERLLRVSTEDGMREISLDEIRPFVRPSCGVCLDMTSEFADLSVGTVEGMEGWNTVVVRTERGDDLVSRAQKRNAIEVKPLPPANFQHLKEASLLKKKRALLTLKSRGELGEGGYVRLPAGWVERILSDSNTEVGL
jgi:coenzyme F420 hydrogenase subunit beta